MTVLLGDWLIAATIVLRLLLLRGIGEVTQLFAAVIDSPTHQPPQQQQQLPRRAHIIS